VRGFRGYYRKILAMIRLLYGCHKIGKQVNGVYLQRREHTSQLFLQSLQGGRAVFSVIIFF